MARPRSFTSSLDSGNWTAGVTDSLQNLSRSFADQNDQRLKREQNVLDREESTRRYEKQQLDSQNVLNKQAANTKSEFDLLSSNHTYTLLDYSPEVQEELLNYRKNLETDKEMMTSFLTGVTKDSKDSDDIAALGASFDASSRSLLSIPGDDELKERVLVQNRVLDLESFRKELKSEDLTAKDRKDRIEEIIASQFGNAIENFDKNIKRGSGLSAERRLQSALSKLSPEQRSTFLDPARVGGILASRVGGTSEDVLQQREKQRIDSLFENDKALAKAKLDYQKLETSAAKKTNKSFSKNYSDNPTQAVANLSKKIGLDISEIYKDHGSKIEESIKHLAEQGFDSTTIEDAILSETKKANWLKFWDDTDIGGLVAMTKAAEDISVNKKKSGNSNNLNIDLRDLLAVRNKERTLPELTMANLGIGSFAQNRLNTSYSFLEQALDDRRLPLPQNDGGRPPTPNPAPTPAPTPTPVVKNIIADSSLTRAVLGSQGAKILNNSGLGEVVESLQNFRESQSEGRGAAFDNFGVPGFLAQSAADANVLRSVSFKIANYFAPENKQEEIKKLENKIQFAVNGSRYQIDLQEKLRTLKEEQ